MAPVWTTWFWAILLYSVYEMPGAIYRAGQGLEVTSTVISPAALSVT